MAAMQPDNNLFAPQPAHPQVADQALAPLQLGSSGDVPGSLHEQPGSGGSVQSFQIVRRALPKQQGVTGLAREVPCVLFALSREGQFFRRAVRPRQRFPAAPGRAWWCGPEERRLLILETGIGAARMETALDWLARGPVLGGVAYRPRSILCGGFSGALRPDLRVGDVVLATEVVDHDGNHWPATWPAAVALPHRGRLLTVPHLVGDPAEKLKLGREHDALAVDMEAATVGRWCSRQGVPFGAVRAISDEVHTALSPRLVSLLSGGRVALLRVLGALVAAPRLAGDLWRLARQTRLAARQLGNALQELV